jgi:hypothetical protein
VPHHRGSNGILIGNFKITKELDLEFTKNITEIMSTLKTFKIRQNFRKLILKVLNLDNLLLQIVHQNGRV